MSHQAPVNISDLSSWESSKDEDLFPEEPNQKSLGNLKHSPGLMNLSKFIESDDDVEDDNNEKEVPKPAVDYPQEKIYDSVENIPDQDDENKIPSEPDRILEAIADYDTGDESDWDDSPRLPEDNVDNFTKKSQIPKKTPEKTGNESDWDSPRVPEGILQF